MRLELLSLFLLCHSLSSATVAQSQVPPAPKAGSANRDSGVKTAPDAKNPDSDQQTAETQTPVTELKFQAQKPIAGTQNSQAFVEPVQCSPSGVPYVSFIDPSDFGIQTVTSLDPNGGHQFSSKSIPGLFDAAIGSYFVSDSTIVILVKGTTDPAKASNTVSPGPGLPPKAVFTGKHGEYLAEFDSSGTFKKLLELPVTYHFWRIALLADDSFVALAYDGPNSAPRLFLLDSDAQIVRPIEIPSDVQNTPALVEGRSGDFVKQAPAESSMSWWLFAPARERVLLYQAHTTIPIIEVGVGGAVREVPIHMPKGFVIDTLVPSDDRWIIRFRKESLSDKGEIDARPGAKNYVLYEVDPTDGHLRRELSVSAGPFYSIACEHDGVFTAFAIDGDKVNLLTADLPR